MLKWKKACLIEGRYGNDREREERATENAEENLEVRFLIEDEG